jgi:hypothetical protein
MRSLISMGFPAPEIGQSGKPRPICAVQWRFFGFDEVSEEGQN